MKCFFLGFSLKIGVKKIYMPILKILHKKMKSVMMSLHIHARWKKSCLG